MSDRHSKLNYSNKMNANKKFESFREYLDMDTDEEEFGRQETPEFDEELPPEPEKPVYTDEDLLSLIKYMTNLTIARSHPEEFFTRASVALIQEYFCNPAHSVLTIINTSSVDGIHGKVLLDFPQVNDGGFTYFLKSPWQIYTPSNFMATIVFGSLNSPIEHSLLKFIKNIYAPITFHNRQWPKVIKNKVFSVLNQLLISLTMASYQPMGLTILHTPCHDSKKILQDHNRDDDDMTEWIERLERVVRHWIKQIREAIKDTRIGPAQSMCTTFMDQIEFWNWKFDNLSCLHHQLSSQTIISIIDILKRVQSASVAKFDYLIKEVEALLTETSSTIIYLNIFKDYGSDFSVPDGIRDYTTNVLLLIRFVGIESNIYNSIGDIEILCRALGTQIIMQCRKYIHLNNVFEGDPHSSKLMVENAISCCEEFFQIFDEILMMDQNSGISSVLAAVNKNNVLLHVDTFMQRCRDLIEIIDARILFHKYNEIKIIDGEELLYWKIEELFLQSLNQIKECRDCILDVTVFAWSEKILNFRQNIENTHNMVLKLIHRIFQDIQNVEEGIEALYAMKRFVTLKRFQEALSVYWTLIWKLFNIELENTNVEKKDEIHAKIKYLQSQYIQLINASDWFHDNAQQPIILEKYKRIQNILQKAAMRN